MFTCTILYFTCDKIKLSIRSNDINYDIDILLKSVVGHVLLKIMYTNIKFCFLLFNAHTKSQVYMYSTDVKENNIC